ncbi:ABC transporter substrate-binding protein [Bifidobacterium adolescentis]|uniref:ABC transporter substrate-binding protein n=1 Tax=Bifidobacterium adolescentis TaxID=1680 RepID=UPI0023313AA0|nr:ABC transporter substrate-binding protein [Bifidobacterium adolescentis]MDB1514556.1 ABC transporter substrate-binding protein [Bifidobacterium adolescentis]MDB1516987.1 ABC transporter substrate-binding protein [Bifidobacterium adolescentis]MDB1519999.1 ABC transporter substrate-binding protein [Bifidobacterium adolescentis]
MKKINMKGMRKLSITATAMVAAAVMALAGCGSSNSSSSSSSSASTSGTKTSKFVLGGLWPETGSLAYLAPPELAAEKLAVKDINDVGGVLGNKITTVDADTSDADHADQNTSAAQSVLSKNPSFIIGPASSSVVKNTYKSITSQNVPMLSMGATSASFSGLSDYFFRTVAPDTVQGAVMGNLIAQDGVQKLAIAVFNDEYGTGLRDTIAKTASEAGVNIVYGEKDTFDPTETNFSSIATAIKASNPDATLVIAFDQTKPLLKALASAGVNTKKLYFVDGNTSDYSSELDAGLLEGSKGTIPGVNPSDDFVKRLESTGVDLKNTTTYGAETYDGIILAALAAQKGGSADGKTIQANMAAVSGSTKGKECDSYKACLALLKDGKEIQYKGQTSIGAFNDAHDPSSASIGVYKYDADNKPVFDHSQEGSVPKA